jgi:hypothetical protein
VRASICASDGEVTLRRTQSVTAGKDDDLAMRARRWVEETTYAQGVSLHLTDPLALRKIARIFGWDEPASDLRPARSRASRRQA